MPQFVCSYAHDSACFADFVVAATSERAAWRQIRKALRNGRCADVNAQPGWENGATHQRVFVQGLADEHALSTTLAELSGEESPVSP